MSNEPAPHRMSPADAKEIREKCRCIIECAHKQDSKATYEALLSLMDLTFKMGQIHAKDHMQGKLVAMDALRDDE